MDSIRKIDIREATFEYHLQSLKSLSKNKSIIWYRASNVHSRQVWSIFLKKMEVHYWVQPNLEEFE